MRPLRLTLEGFTCYRRRVEVDFSDLDLFAITGPTGAGKSSLVDAMAYALYGQAPRVGTRVRELISQGAERMRVTFEFESGGRRYRVARSSARRGHADVQLEEMDPQTGQWLPRADRSAEVNRLVCRAVGMDYEGFVRSVVLPQGRFHLFLVGGREERDRVLEDLLGLDLYRAVMQRANDLAQRCQAQAEELSRRLQTELAYATPQRQRQLKAQALALRQERARLSHLLQVAQEGLERAQRLAQAHQRLQAAQSRLAEAEQQSQGRQQELAQAQERLQGLEGELARLRQEAAAVPFSAEEYARVHADLQRARHLAEARARLQELGAELQELQAHLDRARQGAEAARRHLDAARERAEAAEGERQAAQEVLARARQRQAALEQLWQQWQESARSLAEAGEEVARRQRELEAAQEGAKAARLAAQEAEAALGRAQEGLQARRRQHAAQELRRHLHLGQPCPVCQQTVTSLPPPSDVAPALARAEEEAQEAEARWREAQEALRRASARLERADSALAMARSRQQQEGERQGRLLDALRQVWGEEAAPQEAQARARRAVQEAEEQARAAQDSLSQARASLEQARQRLQAAEKEEERLAARAHALAQQWQELQGRVAARLQELGEERSLQELQQRLQGLEEARQRLEALRQREQELDAQLRDWQQRQAQAREALAALAAQARLAQEEAQQARQEAQELAPGLDALLREQGWDAAAQSLAAGQDIAPLLRQVQQQHADALQGVGQRLGQVEAELERLEQDLRLAARLREELEGARQQGRLARALGDLLRSDRFQAFLRQEALSLLAEDGSRHLQELSRGRYSLVVRRDDFYIQDHWNGDEERPVNTLSGGETFLASLSLALALAEGLPGLAYQSRRTALESLFVDEGFSHLDGETLDVVASALEVLGGPGERMVAVITHVPALAERMPARLRVEKSPEGSTVCKE